MGWARGPGSGGRGVPAPSSPPLCPRTPSLSLLAFCLWLSFLGSVPLQGEAEGGGGAQSQSAQGGASPPLSGESGPLKSPLPPCPTLEIFTGKTTQGPLSWRVAQSAAGLGCRLGQGPESGSFACPRRGSVVQWLTRLWVHTGLSHGLAMQLGPPRAPCSPVVRGRPAWGIAGRIR